MSELAQMRNDGTQATGAGGDHDRPHCRRGAGRREALAASEALIADELLVEEISIDGMCGVY